MIRGQFKGRDVFEIPSCPFCSSPLERPGENRSLEMPMGSCSCGAVYACDVTGHSLGAALGEALVYACKGDSELAWSLLPEEDYLERQIKEYDYETHRIVHGGVYQGRRIGGVLLFIGLKESIGKEKERPLPADPPRMRDRASSGEPARPRALSKEEVEHLVQSYEPAPLLASAETDKRVLRSLKRLLYSPDQLLRWRAAEILGMVSAVIARSDPGAVSKLLQELFSSVTDTASSSWGAIDAIGEIIRFLPEQCSSFIPRLALLSRDRSLLEEVLRALAKIADGKPEALHTASNQLIRLLEDPAPAIQGNAAMLIGRLKIADTREKLERLLESRAEVSVYRNGAAERKTVGQLAAEALENL